MRNLALNRRALASRMIVCLATGAVVNVFVCWGLALFVDADGGWSEIGHGSTGYSREQSPDAANPTFRHLGWGSHMRGNAGRIHASVWYQWLPDGDRYLGAGGSHADSSGRAIGLDRTPPAIIDGSATQVAMILQASGWPFLSLKTELGVAALNSQSTVPGPIACLRQGGIEIASESRWFAPRPSVGHPVEFGPIIIGPNHRELPIQPIWAGFIADSLIYALTAGFAWALLLALRRRLRIRAGRCPTCAYPVAVAPVCPECGTRIAPAFEPAN